jgi:hypothetical protein
MKRSRRRALRCYDNYLLTECGVQSNLTCNGKEIISNACLRLRFTIYNVKV